MDDDEGRRAPLSIEPAGMTCQPPHDRFTDHLNRREIRTQQMEQLQQLAGRVVAPDHGGCYLAVKAHHLRLVGAVALARLDDADLHASSTRARAGQLVSIANISRPEDDGAYPCTA